MITLHGFAFQNLDAPQELKEEVRSTIERGIGAMNRICVFGPYVLGGEMTMADIYLRYVLKVVNLAGAARLEWDIVGEIDGLTEWDAMMAESVISQKVEADQEANAPQFFNHLKERFGI
jgi:glutathione S-transferase